MTSLSCDCAFPAKKCENRRLSFEKVENGIILHSCFSEQGTRSFVVGMGEYQSGQLGQTVNLLSYDFIGSNPISPTARAVTLAKAGKETIRLRARLRRIICGSSSVGRAIAFQAIGRGFEPRLPLWLQSDILGSLTDRTSRVRY